jgi:hypothetical protein
VSNFEVQFLAPGKKGMQRERTHDHINAAKIAVERARAGYWNVVVMRFDQDAGWKLGGRVHQIAGDSKREGIVLIYEDRRTAREKAADTAAAEQGTTDEPRAKRSRMFVFAAGARHARRTTP